MYTCVTTKKKGILVFSIFIFLIDELKNFFFRIFALEIDLDFRE